MTLHLELAQGSRSRTDAGVLYGAPFVDGCKKLIDTRRTKLLGVEGCTELNGSQFVRLSRSLGESFPDLRGMQVQVLKELCLVANCSEEFFLSCSKDQWLRTAIISPKSPKALFSSELLKKQCHTLISSITIHSIVVPWHLYWPKLQAVRDKTDEVANKRIYFPSTVLEVALSEDKSLVEKLKEWEKKNEECAIAKQWHERENVTEKTSRPFWKIEPNDVEVLNSTFVEGGSQAGVWRISWRGGIFARKVFMQQRTFDTELEVVRRVSHPHIVYSFGVSMHIDSKKQAHHSLLMELLDRDLFALIEDRVRLRSYDRPPFSRQESFDILLQIAKAMEYLHNLDEPVIHGDLKPKNILVSHCEILGDVSQYFVKVADFGSSSIILKSNSSSTFNPEGGTTQYAAPEVLKARSERTSIKDDDPKKIDVYSFGIIAFQVLTGLEPYKKFKRLEVSKKPYQGVPSREVLKEGVIAGTLRPPLEEACSRPNFWNDSDLIELVKRCWDRESSARPHFSEVVVLLETIYNDLTQTNGSIVISGPQVNAANGASLVNAVEDAPQANAVEDAPQANVVEDIASPMNVVEHIASSLIVVQDAPQVNVVDDAPQTNGSHVHLESATNEMLIGAPRLISTGDDPLRSEVHQVTASIPAPVLLKVQDKPRSTASRKKASINFLSWICISPAKTLE